MTKVYTDKMSVTREQVEAAHDMFRVNVAGISPELKAELERRIEEFEEKHEWDALHGGDGWVKRISHIDILIAAGINVVWLIWWAISIIT